MTAVICSMLSSSSSGQDSHDSLRFLGSQIAQKVLWNWVTGSPRLCREHQTSVSEFPQGFQAAMGGSWPGSSPRALASFQELLSLDLLAGCFLQKVTKSLWVSWFELGFPQEPKAEHMYNWFQFAPCWSCMLLGNNPLSLCPQAFSSSSRDTCALLWQEEMWKIRYSLMSAPVELLNLRSFMSDIDGT